MTAILTEHKVAFMPTQTKIPAIQPIARDEALQATVGSLQKMLEVLFYFFEEKEDELEYEENLNDFLQAMWDISIISLLAAGVKIIGKTEDGTYVATVKPLKDFKKFMCEEDYGDESQTFFEDMCEIDEDAAIGEHEKYFAD